MRRFVRCLAKAAVALPLLPEAWEALQVGHLSRRHATAAAFATASVVASVAFLGPLAWWALTGASLAGLMAWPPAVVSVACAIAWAAADPDVAS